MKPRFEFRTFAQEFGMVETKMRRRSAVDKIRESDEIYIISATNDENNTKIRIESVDVAAILKTRHELGLDEYENVNYLRAIKRIVGLAPLPR